MNDTSVFPRHSPVQRLLIVLNFKQYSPFSSVYQRVIKMMTMSVVVVVV